MRPLACSKVQVAVLLPLPSGSSPALGLAETSPQLVTPGLALALGTLLMSPGRAASQPFPPALFLLQASSPQPPAPSSAPPAPSPPHLEQGQLRSEGASQGSAPARSRPREAASPLLCPKSWHAALHCAHYRPLLSEQKVRSLLTGLPLEITPSPFISSHADPGEAGTKGAAPPGPAGPGCPTLCLLEAGLALGAVAPSPPGLELGAQTLPSYQLPNKPWWLQQLELRLCLCSLCPGSQKGDLGALLVPISRAWLPRTMASSSTGDHSSLWASRASPGRWGPGAPGHTGCHSHPQPHCPAPSTPETPARDGAGAAAQETKELLSPQIGQHPSHSPRLGKAPKHGQAPQPLTLMFPLASRRMFSSFRSLCTIPFCKGRQSRAQLRVLEEGKGWGGHCRSPTGVDPSQGGEISGNNPRFVAEDELEATSRPGCYQQGFSHMPAPRTRLLHPLGPTPQGEPSSGLCWDLPKQHPEVLRAQEAPRSLLSLPRAGSFPALRMSHVRPPSIPSGTPGVLAGQAEPTRSPIAPSQGTRW